MFILKVNIQTEVSFVELECSSVTRFTWDAVMLLLIFGKSLDKLQVWIICPVIEVGFLIPWEINTPMKEMTQMIKTQIPINPARLSSSKWIWSESKKNDLH